MTVSGSIEDWPYELPSSVLELELADPVDVELLPVPPDVPVPDEELPDVELPELPDVELDDPEVLLELELLPSLTLVDVPDFSSLASFFTNTTD
jgi:hypothetical protein